MGSLKNLTGKLIRILAALVVLLLAVPFPVIADGGPMVDPIIFDKLKEGQQTAVVTVQDMNTARVDLFVSILDQSGESHEITYFVPLGLSSSAFGVREENSLDFNDALTEDLDRVLFQETRQNQDILRSLYAGTLLTNGVWLMPLWFPLLTGCGGEETVAVSVFTTDSSTISVFDINQTMDIAALISTTGLDPAVTDTLKRLEGQQIAVINMKTQAAVPPGPSTGETVSGEPGLHLSWTTSLKLSGSGATYAYPLGTGAAWSQPIELTRVYVMAPASIGLSVDFPRLGVNNPGYIRTASRYEPRIVGSLGKPAYAIEHGRASLIVPNMGQRDVNIWRATYTHSNAADDILITVSEGGGGGLQDTLRQGGLIYGFAIGLVAAAFFWVLSWYLLMPRLLGRHDMKGLWHRPFVYMAINWLLLVIPGVILMIVLSFGQSAGALLTTFLVFGAAGAITFIIRDLNKLGATGSRAITSFIVVTLVSNAAYFLFALGYARLAGAI